jgi:DNA-binding CsgD family transcriptional regulator
MSVFAAPASTAMVAELLVEASIGGQPGRSREAAVGPVLAHLVRRGLVSRPRAAGPPASFLLVAAVRGTAADLLVDAGELGAAEDAHTRAVLHLAMDHGPALDGSLEVVAFAALARSEADLHLALRRLTGRAQVRDGLRLACALVPFVIRRGYDGLVGPALTSLLHQAEDWQPDDVQLAQAHRVQAHLASCGIAAQVLGPGVIAPQRHGPADDQQLTRREWDVLGQLTTGATNKEIGARLGLAPKTVMHHSMAVYRKLGVRSRAEATAWAFRHGVIS